MEERRLKLRAGEGRRVYRLHEEDGVAVRDAEATAHSHGQGSRHKAEVHVGVDEAGNAGPEVRADGVGDEEGGGERRHLRALPHGRPERIRGDVAVAEADEVQAEAVHRAVEAQHGRDEEVCGVGGKAVGQSVDCVGHLLHVDDVGEGARAVGHRSGRQPRNSEAAHRRSARQRPDLRRSARPTELQLQLGAGDEHQRAGRGCVAQTPVGQGVGVHRQLGIAGGHDGGAGGRRGARAIEQHGGARCTEEHRVGAGGVQLTGWQRGLSQVESRPLVLQTIAAAGRPLADDGQAGQHHLPFEGQAIPRVRQRLTRAGHGDAVHVAGPGVGALWRGDGA